MRGLIFLALIPLALTFRISNGPPPFWQKALMARYIIHTTGYVSIATISVQDDIKGYPFATIKSISDGPADNSTGNVYFYMSDMELSQQDIEKDSRCTILASLADVGYCEEKKYDPQDPRCAKAILTGRLVRVSNETSEYDFAKSALLEKHPAMKSWPTDHGFFVSKLDIEQIEVLDFFGGISKVSKEDYFNATPGFSTAENIVFNRIDIIDVQIV
ncbi:protein CREG1 [Coccinella septempunctata]|uniref:protein CREG1 n=1 Tax=Coccinella septempunctata TaxID=41139 RepID=UPI001D05E2E3|nr:protein CREG1 [Coccinella septempunctata]XP_044761407.1 protein CREG1 [Coccinella septempunctata]XP_044761408.1 protein CREG1 [Coccinella septempunctata]